MSSIDKELKVLASQRGVEKCESTNESLGTTVVWLFEQLFFGVRIRLIL